MALGISGTGWLAISAIASAAGGVVQADQTGASQRRGIRRQAVAQRQAEANAGSQRRESRMAQRSVNRQQADIAGILAAEQAEGGVSSLLTGPQGVDSSRLRLGGQKPLGSGGFGNGFYTG